MFAKLRLFGSAALVLCLLILLSACGSSDTVKIGVIIPINSEDGANASLSDYGYQIRSGIQLAADELANRRGEGENQIFKNYELIWENEPQDMDGVVKAFNNLKEQGVHAIIGAASSEATMALAPLANKNRILLVSPASSSPEINTGQPDYVYRNFPSDTLEAQKLANVIFQRCRIQKCLMVRSRSEYASGITFELLKFARQNSQKLPNEVVKFDADADNIDYTAIVDRIVEIAPEGVFLGAYVDKLIPLINEIRSREELSQLYIFTSSAFLYERAVKELGAETVEGVMFTGYHWDPNEARPNIQAFSQKFESEWHHKPTIYAATGYDAFQVIVNSAENVDHTIGDDFRLEVGKIEHTNLLLGNGKLQFNKRGDVTMIPNVYWIKNGQKLEMTDEDMEEIKREILTRI
jgi:branched-chain amino acid transport system substrate-binding protein